MQSVTNAQKHPWKDAAMEKAECITDIWEVVKAYMGRAAEWVLFLCMVINIIQMLPGVNVAGWILNLVLSVQVVMLDIGGMSLSSMAEHAKEKGEVANAKKADITSKFLIGLMITTLLLVAAGVLFPAIKQYTDMAEKGLILVRVVMTVIYGHVIHSLRGSGHQAPVPATPAVPSGTELETLIKDILVPVLQQYRTETKADIAEQIKRVLPALTQQSKVSQDIPTSDTSAEAPQLQSVALLSVRRRQKDVSRARSGGTQLNREARIASAYRELIQESVRPTGDTLSRRAHCNRAAALKWLKTKQLAG
jgi:hypothetical protein